MPSKPGGQWTHNHPKSRKSGSDASTARIFLLSTIPAIITLVLLKFLTSPSNPLRTPLFDASSSLIGGQDDPTIRWDAIHFLSIATKGYEYEQQLAFQPGWQGVLYAVGRVWSLITKTGKTRHADGIIYGSQVMMVLLAGWRGAALYK
jgi:phosphatidylinositol glycan class V